MSFNEPESGERTAAGVYRTPSELAEILRGIANSLEGHGDKWGGMVLANYVVSTVLPWEAAGNFHLEITFRDAAPHVADICAGALGSGMGN